LKTIIGFAGRFHDRMAMFMSGEPELQTCEPEDRSTTVEV